MIYDGHAYCAQDPSLGGGFEDRAEFDRFLQLFMATSRQQPVWRKRDRVPGDASGLVDPARPWDFDALREAGFRTAENGRVEWDVDGETYIKQALPPWVDHLIFTVDNLVAEMDYVGVDMALLHRTPYMSKSNEFIAECVRAYPDRIQGLAYIEEWLLASDTDACIEKLQHAINDLGLHGYQFMPHHMDLYGLDWKWASPAFTPFWDALSDLDIPVFFTLHSTSYAEYLEELRTLGRWMERYPDVTVVQTHGFNWRMFSDDEKLVVPDEVYDAAPHRQSELPHPASLRRFPPAAMGLPHAPDPPDHGEDVPSDRPGEAHLGNGHTRLPTLVDLPPESRLHPRLLRLHTAVRHGPHPRRKHGANHGSECLNRRVWMTGAQSSRRTI